MNARPEGAFQEWGTAGHRVPRDDCSFGAVWAFSQRHGVGFRQGASLADDRQHVCVGYLRCGAPSSVTFPEDTELGR